MNIEDSDQPKYQHTGQSVAPVRFSICVTKYDQ